MDKAEEVQRGEMEKANTWKRQGRTAAVPAQPEPCELLVNGVLIWRRWDFQSKHITKLDALLWAQVHCLHTPACFQHITNATPSHSLIPLRWIHLLIIRSSGFQRSLPLNFVEITKKILDLENIRPHCWFKGNTSGGSKGVQTTGDYQVTHEDFIISSTIWGLFSHYSAGDNRLNH